LKTPQQTRILVLEDDLGLLEMVGELLEDHGYVVTLCSDSPTAISSAQRSSFDLLLTDVRMAGPLDGVATLAEIKRIRPNIGSIIMTGYADLKVPTRAAELRADDYLLKGHANFGLETLLKSVNKVLEARQVEQPALVQRWLNRMGWKGTQAEKAEQTEVALTTQRLQELDEARNNFYKSYFMLLRSNHYSLHEAYDIWCALEALERRLDAQGFPIDSQESECAAIIKELNTLLYQKSTASHDLTATTLVQFRAILENVASGQLQRPAFQQLLPLKLFPELQKASFQQFALCQEYWNATSSTAEHRLDRPESDALPEGYRCLGWQRPPFLRLAGPTQLWDFLEPISHRASRAIALDPFSLFWREGSLILLQPQDSSEESYNKLPWPGWDFVSILVQLCTQESPARHRLRMQGAFDCCQLSLPLPSDWLGPWSDFLLEPIQNWLKNPKFGLDSLANTVKETLAKDLVVKYPRQALIPSPAAEPAAQAFLWWLPLAWQLEQMCLQEELTLASPLQFPEHVIYTTNGLRVRTGSEASPKHCLTTRLAAELVRLTYGPIQDDQIENLDEWGLGDLQALIQTGVKPESGRWTLPKCASIEALIFRVVSAYQTVNPH
jgi:CheY-like chemotaxis protein